MKQKLILSVKTRNLNRLMAENQIANLINMVSVQSNKYIDQEDL